MSEIMPKLRFGEFDDSWQEKPLIDLSVDGFANGVFNDPNKIGKGYKLVNVKDMYSGDVINPDDLTLLELSKSEFAKNQVQYGDIFFTRSSLVKEGIAHSNVMLEHTHDTTYDGHLIRFRPKPLELSPAFAAKVMKTSVARRQFVARGKTGTMTTIGQDDIASVKIAFPTLQEQQKIASFLSAVDEKIGHLERRLELLQTYKRGVMQKLFSREVRFKREDGSAFPDWESKTIGTLGEIITGKTPNTSQKDIWEGGIPFITPSDIEENKYQHSTERAVRNSATLKLLPANSIVYTCIASIGKMSITVEPSITNQQINSIIPKSSYNHEFIYYALLYMTPKIKALRANTTLPIINKSEFSKFSLETPCRDEQDKIVSFLSAIDTKLDALSTQISQLRRFKKGLLQQMFV